MNKLLIYCLFILWLGIGCMWGTPAWAVSARNAALGSTLNVDFDGNERPQGSANDIGADEVAETTVDPTSFTLSNAYIEVIGAKGLITSLRIDGSGQRNYGTNTIAATGHLGFYLNGTLLTDTNVTLTRQYNQVTISGLPLGATLIVMVSGNALLEKLQFSGTQTVKHEWDLVYLDAGFYQRSTGRNYGPDQTVDMPFESFYNLADGIFRPVEHFKKGAGSLVALNWAQAYCRGRRASDAVFSCSHAAVNFLPQSDRLTLVNEGSAASPITTRLTIKPKSYSTTLNDARPLPEFYVSPDAPVTAFSDTQVTHTTSNLLTELYQHAAFWFGAGAPYAIDWSLRGFCLADTPLRDAMLPTNWIIGDDGYGHYGYAYTWGLQRGWPFPSGKDTRHFNTNALVITGLWRSIMWTGNTSYLNSGPRDRKFQIQYSSGSNATWPSSGTFSALAISEPGTTSQVSFGQTFTASAPFTGIGASVAAWGTTNGSYKLTLYNSAGGTTLASQTFTNVTDGTQMLTFAAQPAGQYYVEMSNASGLLGWWTTDSDTYSGGQSFLNGHPEVTMIERARALMQYQQSTLLGASQNLLVLGSNIGSADHGARHATDVGSCYYDILPFGYKDAYTNADYYLSLKAMADLEDCLGNTAQAQVYRDQLPGVRQKYNDTFWRTGRDRNGAARYIGSVDVNGADHDYGFTFINTKALEAGLVDDYPERAAAIYQWMDEGESLHSTALSNYVVRVGYADGGTELKPDPALGSASAVQLSAGNTLQQKFFARRPFTAVAAYNPTWGTSTSGFTLKLYKHTTSELIATRSFTNVADNSENRLTFAAQPAGYYLLEMSAASGAIGWWSSPWVGDIYDRWLFAPRVSTRNNTDWWAYAVGTMSGPDYDPTDPNFAWRWDRQLQNGGADLYESGYDVIVRARYLGADNAWERLQTILKRYSDPDRLCSRSVGFYGESIQGDGTAGSVGWMRSEFPETTVLGSAFFMGFFGVQADAAGLHLTPHIPTGHGITTLGAKNISYQGALFNLEATATSVRVACTQNSQNKSFYMTTGITGMGLFTKDVPLRHGTMVLSTKPIPKETSAQSWWILQ
jgi:hypothetical protein